MQMYQNMKWIMLPSLLLQYNITNWQTRITIRGNINVSNKTKYSSTENIYATIWFLGLSEYFTVMSGRVFLGQTSTKQGISVLFKDTAQ